VRVRSHVANLTWTIRDSAAEPRQGLYTGSVRNDNVPHGIGRLRFSNCHRSIRGSLPGWRHAWTRWYVLHAFRGGPQYG
jgi:hypothetical protein